MSQFNRIKDLFKQLFERRKDILEYWKKSPTTKIVLINTGVYVTLTPLSACGNSNSYRNSF